MAEKMLPLDVVPSSLTMTWMSRFSPLLPDGLSLSLPDEPSLSLPDEPSLSLPDGLSLSLLALLSTGGCTTSSPPPHEVTVISAVIGSSAIRDSKRYFLISVPF